MASKKRKRRCEVCGENDRKMTCFTVMIDGKREARWRLCLGCAAVKRVLLGTHKYKPF